jgi:DNA-binding beta-propeller fold protein YncE
LLEARDCPSTGYLLVPSFDTQNVLRYDATTGAFVDEFVPHKSGGLNQPNAVDFGPRDHDLYLTSGFYEGTGQVRAVLRYDGSTGKFLDQFTQGSLVDKVVNILFGPDGNVYVGITVEGPGISRVARFDAATGAYLGDFIPPGSGGLQTLGGMVFGPSVENPHKLDLYVASARKNNVLRFDGTTGAFLGEFVPAGLGGLTAAIGITFGADGNLYVASGGALNGGPTSGVLRFQGPTGAAPGAFIDTFVTPGSGGLLSPFGVLFGPDANGDGRQDLYVGGSQLVPAYHSKEHTSTIKLYDGATGAYLRDFVTADSGGLGSPGHMKFTGTDPMTLAYTGDHLMAASPSPIPTAESLEAGQVRPLFTEAMARWQAAAATSGFGSIRIQIANFGGNTLGLASGHTIWLDDNAAGWGWFVDPTPLDDSEFTTPGNQGEQHRMDLLSALMHEVGHLLGHEHEGRGVMKETLSAGERLALHDAPFNDVTWLAGIPGLTRKRDQLALWQ